MKFLIFLLFATFTLNSQSIEYFPNNLNVQPFSANFLEPKVGFLFQTGKNELRLDIGNSRDILHFSGKNYSSSFGVDFFTFTKLSGEGEFHFPVNAIDYLFGVNLSYKSFNENTSYGFRFRLSHISAHFVDGHYDNPTGMWKNGRYPRVYSREFIEVFPFIESDYFRSYIGYTYLFHVVPKDLGRHIFQFGTEYYLNDLNFLNVTPFLAYDFKLAKINVFEGTNSINAGLKFGKHDGAGFSLMLNYYSGRSVHGEYFDYYDKYTSVSFNFDL